MDYSGKLIEVIKKLDSNLDDINIYSKVLTKVIELFEISRKEPLSSSDIEILRIIALKIGVPSLYKMIENNQSKEYQFQMTIENISSIYNETKYYIFEDIMLHRYQLEFLNMITLTHNFRYFITAPTSFGKTLLMKELVKLKEYRKILFILPSIALISENLADFYTEKRYFELNRKYMFITLIDEDDKELYEGDTPIIFLLTIERYIALVSFANVQFNFSFVDEIYKIDEFLSNEDVGECMVSLESQYDIGREVSYRYGLNSIIQRSQNIALAGPYLNIQDENTRSFLAFLNSNNFDIIDYNVIEIVNKENYDCREMSRSSTNSIIVDGETVLLNSTKKTGKFLQLVEFLLEKNESTLIYASSIKMINAYSRLLVVSYNEIELSEEMRDFIYHLKSKFHVEWRLIHMLSRGFGFHHGRLPKYVQKEIVSLYNSGEIKLLITTTSIIEGVNTIAKNMIILSSKKGNKELNKFDALNIIGRTGRFTKHFYGRCFFLDSGFNNILQGQNNILRHSLYSENEKKSTTDLFIAEDQYLTDSDFEKRTQIIETVENFGIKYSDLFNISPDIDMNLKIDILSILISDYEHVQMLLRDLTANISKRYVKTNYMNNFINCFRTVLNNLGLEQYLFDIGGNIFLSYKINQYLINGLQGMIQGYINYLTEKEGENLSNKRINEIINEDLKLTANVFRFEIPRFLGLVERINQLINEQIFLETKTYSINSLIELLEYEAETKKGKVAYDFGASQNVIKVFDGKEIQLDRYELRLMKMINDTLFGNEQ